MSDHIEKTIAEAEAKLREREEEVRVTKALINRLCEMAGRPALYVVESEERGAVLPYNGDEYYGKKQHSACRSILERRSSMGLGPATLEELYDDLQAGGYHFDASNDANAKRGLRAMLSQNSSVFHRLPNQKYGLVEWYDSIPKRKGRRGRRRRELEDLDDDEGPEMDDESDELEEDREDDA